MPSFSVSRFIILLEPLRVSAEFLLLSTGPRPNGILQIVPEEAEVVRTIFDLYIQGNRVRKIKRYLEEHGIKTVTGKTEWSTSTIDRMLSNEKYVGEVRMQKTFTANFLTGRREKMILSLCSIAFFAACVIIYLKKQQML